MGQALWASDPRGESQGHVYIAVDGMVYLPFRFEFHTANSTFQVNMLNLVCISRAGLVPRLSSFIQQPRFTRSVWAAFGGVGNTYVEGAHFT